ncbi:bestrophin family protein [Sulfitobacter sp. TB366]|uniref:bestrophin family protein n=1 Tax=unclassified Sulfitobacter TaxID=196795 RepID=UPI0037461A06
MIVRDLPTTSRLFFVTQGSVVPKIIGKIFGVALISAIALLVDRFLIEIPRVSISAMSVFGIALSLFLGFRNNAAYERWWEARKLWGSIIADVRCLGRDSLIFIKNDASRKEFVSLSVAFAHFSRGGLRRADVSEDILKWIDEEEFKSLSGHQNPPDATLRSMATTISNAIDKDEISNVGQLRISSTLSSLGNAQAGCERISSTPLPFVYSLLIRRTTYLYCWLLPFALVEAASWLTPIFTAVVGYVFFGLQEVTHELENPYSNAQNGLPLDAMCRTIEISASEALKMTPPDILEPKSYVLT